MKKLLAILAVTFALQGCMWQTVNANDIEFATKVCASMNATVVEIEVQWNSNEFVMCSNRQTRALTAVR